MSTDDTENTENTENTAGNGGVGGAELVGDAVGVEAVEPSDPEGDVERMPGCDLDDGGDRLRLVRHVLAMMNAGGGTIVIGVRRSGARIGLSPEAAARFEGAAVNELVDDYLRPDSAAITATTVEGDDGRPVVELAVSGHDEPPVVPGIDGAKLDDSGNVVEMVFTAGEVLTRRNGRTERARRDDHRRWRSEALGALRRELQERLRLVVGAPQGATIRVVTDDEVLDEPSYFLSRATEQFRLRPEQLLSGNDLLYLWRHRSTLSFDAEATRLVLHSALRRRATLYAWLAVLPVSSAQVRSILFEAVGMRDRDKSDAARAVLLVCALYLNDGDYTTLIKDLRSSSYAHMRAAAESMPDPAQAHEQLRSERSVGHGQEQLVTSTDVELLDLLDSLLVAGGQPPRRASSLGLELLTRKLERRRNEFGSADEAGLD